MTIGQMIKNRVSQGYAHQDSATKLFDEGFSNHSGDSLAKWLHVNHYATELQAAEYVTDQAAFEASL